MLQEQKQTELLNEQSQSENKPTNKETSSNGELTYQKEHEDTGIFIRGTEKGYFATAGPYRISKVYQEPEEVEELLYNRDWSIIMCLVDAMLQFNEEYKNEALINKNKATE